MAASQGQQEFIGLTRSDELLTPDNWRTEIDKIFLRNAPKKPEFADLLKIREIAHELIDKKIVTEAEVNAKLTDLHFFETDSEEDSLEIPADFRDPEKLFTLDEKGGFNFFPMTPDEMSSLDQKWRTPHDASFNADSSLPRYLVKDQEINSGGMGQIYDAFDLKTRMNVVLKMSIRQPDQSDEQLTYLQDKLLQEAKLEGKFQTEDDPDHRISFPVPNTLPVLDVIPQSEQGPIMILKKMDSETQPFLDRLRNKEGKLKPEQVIQILQDISKTADSLWEKHQTLHLDLKPANIVYDKESGHAVLADFGLATKVDTSEDSDNIFPMGTYNWLSPERILGKNLDVRSEVYSLALITYNLLTNEKLFNVEIPAVPNETAKQQRERKKTNEMYSLYAILTEEQEETVKIGLEAALASEYNQQIIDNVAEVINKALKKSPDERYQTATEFADALKAGFG